jgi:hypothetical protein
MIVFALTWSYIFINLTTNLAVLRIARVNLKLQQMSTTQIDLPIKPDATNRFPL